MPITVSLGKELEDRLNRLSDITKRSKSLYVKEAVLEYLERMEQALLATAYPTAETATKEKGKPDT